MQVNPKYRKPLAIALGALLTAILLFWAGYTKGLENRPVCPALSDPVSVTADDKANSTAQRNQASARKREAEEKKVERELIKANPDWASEPLPADIAASLHNEGSSPSE